MLYLFGPKFKALDAYYIFGGLQILLNQNKPVKQASVGTVTIFGPSFISSSRLQAAHVYMVLVI